jgi:hypothetical protein
MGYGPVVNGKQTPITPWRGSWAQQMQCPKCPHGKGFHCPTCWPKVKEN